MRKLSCILLFMMILSIARSQEFHCTVTVNADKLLASKQTYETADKKIFETMKQSIEEFVNSRRWTQLNLEQHEKLECSIGLALSSRTSATEFGGQLSVQLKRPVFGSTYTTGLFNYIEPDFQFAFNESQSIEFDPNTFFGNLSSTIAYYVYIMLGEYFDSFSPSGGDVFYEMARTIQQSAPADMRGWQPKSGSKARYWFMENHTNSAYAPLRQAYYDYHRMGLDLMTKDQKQARANILRALDELQQVSKVKANVLSVQQFVDVKMSEIVSIFTPAPVEEQTQVYLAIKAVSPINVSKLKDWNLK